MSIHPARAVVMEPIFLDPWITSRCGNGRAAPSRRARGAPMVG